MGATKFNMHCSHPPFGIVAGTLTLSPLCASLELRTASSATGGAVLRSPRPPPLSTMCVNKNSYQANTASQGRCSNSMGASKLASVTKLLSGLVLKLDCTWDWYAWCCGWACPWQGSGACLALLSPRRK